LLQGLTVVPARHQHDLGVDVDAVRTQLVDLRQDIRRPRVGEELPSQFRIRGVHRDA
jgi:hypothetical protein